MTVPSFTEWLAALPAGWLEAVQHGFPFELEELEEGSSSRKNRVVRPREGFALEVARLGSSAEFAQLPEDQKRQFIAKLSTQKVTPKRPRMARIDDLIRLDNQRSDGLLGRLVAQYWIGQRTRSWYQTRCGSHSFCDDTPLWLSRDNPWHSHDKYLANLKNEKWYGVGHTEDYWKKRYYNNDSGSLFKHRGRASLEATFSNWSRPAPFDFKQWEIEIKQKDAKLGQTAGAKSEKFRYNEIGFAEFFSDYVNWDIWWGYKDEEDDPFDVETYDNVIALKKFPMNAIPWRRFDLVSSAERKSANYKWKTNYGTETTAFMHWIQYHVAGYGLVRTGLDVLLARGNWDIVKFYPEFAKHCNWWLIPVPTRDLVMQAPDLSAIGGGVSGLADVPTDVLLKYIMSITPAPGTIPPWEDNGPLWTWPEDAGSMSILRVQDGTLGPRDRQSAGAWGTIAQFVLGVEMSICAGVASGVVSEAVDVVVDQVVDKATEIASEWLGAGVEKVLDAVDSTLGGAVLDAAKEAIGNCSAFAANIRNFTSGTNLIPEFQPTVDLAGRLTSYLDGAADGLASWKLNELKTSAESLIDGLRKSWDWADDLVGAASSWGEKASKAASGVIK